MTTVWIGYDPDEVDQLERLRGRTFEVQRDKDVSIGDVVPLAFGRENESGGPRLYASGECVAIANDKMTLEVRLPTIATNPVTAAAEDKAGLPKDVDEAVRRALAADHGEYAAYMVSTGLDWIQHDCQARAFQGVLRNMGFEVVPCSDNSTPL